MEALSFCEAGVLRMADSVLSFKAGLDRRRIEPSVELLKSNEVVPPLPPAAAEPAAPAPLAAVGNGEAVGVAAVCLELASGTTAAFVASCGEDLLEPPAAVAAVAPEVVCAPLLLLTPLPAELVGCPGATAMVVTLALGSSPTLVGTLPPQPLCMPRNRVRTGFFAVRVTRSRIALGKLFGKQSYLHARSMPGQSRIEACCAWRGWDGNGGRFL